MTGLVSVGIPTYRRSRELERAVRSVLAQDHADVEVVVSDDASGDETEAVCRRLQAEDPRVRYVLQERNLGHARNFQAVLEAARGDRFMWLSDDDWIEPDYVSRCVAALDSDASLVAVCGRGRYHRDGRFVVQERAINLRSRRNWARVLRYFAEVDVNGVLYSVMPRDLLLSLGFREVIGGDWLLMSAVAAHGCVQTLEGTHVMRSITGISEDAESFARAEFGLRGARARNPHLAIAAGVLRSIGWEDPGFRPLGTARLPVGAAAAMLVALRFTGVILLRGLLSRLRLLGVARRVVAPLRARRHR